MPAKIIESSRNWVVLDIDGCIIDSTERLPHLLNGDREAYDELHPTDVTIPHGVALYKLLLREHACMFVTSRSECARDYTMRQLCHVLDYDLEAEDVPLLMRPLGAYGVPDEVLKPQLVMDYGVDLGQILMAVDDRTSMVAHWRSLGVPCIQPVADHGMHVPDNSQAASK